MCVCQYLDCKTVRIFAYSSTREQSNKRSGISLLMLRKKPTVLQSSQYLIKLKGQPWCERLVSESAQKGGVVFYPGLLDEPKFGPDRLACN